MSDFFEDSQAFNAASPKHSYARRSGKLGRIIRSGIVLAVVAALVVFAGTLAFPHVKDLISATQVEDYSDGAGSETMITIPEGASGSDIGEILVAADIVASRQAFVNAFDDNPRANSIQPGIYKLRTHISGASAVAALLNPASRAELKVTIPEGSTTMQVFEKVANVFGVSEDEVKAAAQDSAAIGLPEEANGNLEGWLSPLTYEFTPDTALTDVFKEMVTKRTEELEDSGIPRDKWQRQLTIASIVEREVNWPEYYPKVARVIENRIKEGSETAGLLQMDSTVEYGLGRSSGVPTADELKQDTPYNTYLHKGLPPTPIANPSVEVIKATIDPPEGDWLFFTTVDLTTGETLFTADYEEHKKNAARFQQWYSEHQDEVESDDTPATEN